MALSAVSQQFLREVKATSDLLVKVDIDERLQPPLLARVKMVRGGIPLHRVSYHPNAGAMTGSYLVEAEPDRVDGRVALGVALGGSDDNSSAAEALAMAIELAPDDPWAKKKLEGTLFRLGRGDEARGHRETAVQLAPQDAQSWLLLGNICLSVGAVDAGRQALKQARTLDPHGPFRSGAEAALNLLAESELPRNADGVNLRALETMIAALKRLRSMTPEAAKQVTLQAAFLGQRGLRLQDHARIHQLEGIAQLVPTPESAADLEAAREQFTTIAEDLKRKAPCR